MPSRRHDDIKKSKENDIRRLPQKEEINITMHRVVGVLLTIVPGEANLKRNEINGADDMVMECHSRRGVSLQPSKLFLNGAIRK